MATPTSPASEAKRPRIAMVSTHGYVAANPPLGAADTGGQVVFVLELSKKLAQLGYGVDIWTRRFEDQPEEDAVSDHVRVLRAPCGGSRFIPKEYLHEHLAEWEENALRLIRRQNLEYQFINSHYWDAGIVSQRLAHTLRATHVHTPHSLGVWKQRQMLTDYPQDAAKFEKEFNFSVRNREERRLFHACDLVVATTPVQTDMLRADYEVPESKLRMIPPGYDDNRFFPVGEATRAAVRQRLGFTGHAVLALGRLASNKGYDLLIQAFAETARRDPEARLYLAVGGEKMDAGEKRILEECRALASTLGLVDRVHFSGYVADEDLSDTYRAADVFVLSSRYEPFGMTAVEAMACGTPVVATTHGGLFRVLRFGVDGLFADTFDAADLGLTILKPLRHPKLWDRLSRNAAQTARSLFTWTGIAQQLLRAVEGRAAPGVELGSLESDPGWFGHDDNI